jgi:N-methylhydantoinase B
VEGRVVRELEALEEMTFSLIGERRGHAPPGAAGGEPGTKGCDTLKGAGTLIGANGSADACDARAGAGTLRRLPAKTTGTLHIGERLRIETPGGGGWGPPFPTPP